MIPPLFWAVFWAAVALGVLLHTVLWVLDKPAKGPTWRQRRQWRRERADIRKAQERRR